MLAVFSDYDHGVIVPALFEVFLSNILFEPSSHSNQGPCFIYIHLMLYQEEYMLSLARDMLMLSLHEMATFDHGNCCSYVIGNETQNSFIQHFLVQTVMNH